MKKQLLPTHAYGHRLADVHLGGFAPAFTLSFHDSECSRKPPNAHSLGRWQQAEKKLAIWTQVKNAEINFVLTKSQNKIVEDNRNTFSRNPELFEKQYFELK